MQESSYLCFSANSNYELGRGDKLGGWKPQPVPSLKDVRIVQIASGGYHSIALTGMVMRIPRFLCTHMQESYC